VRRELSPAAIGSILLHLSVAAALLISWPWARDLKVGAVVPVTIVANAPETDLRAAEAAPVEQAAATPEPVAEAPAQIVPPEPQPTPVAKPVPAPPKPEPAKAAEKPVPPKPTPKPEKTLDLAALSASVSKLIPKSTAKASSAPKGAAKAETAKEARPDLGSGQAAAQAMAGLADELQRRWNPNCEVEGGRDVVVRVIFVLNGAGQVTGRPEAQVTRGAQSSVTQAAADRAVRAVYGAAPFRNLPREFYGDRIAVNFNAREACS
jgi:outer membrane biosynthesis protein TonB